MERRSRNLNIEPKFYKSGYGCGTTVVTKLPLLILLQWGLVSGEGDAGKGVENNARCFTALGLHDKNSMYVAKDRGGHSDGKRTPFYLLFLKIYGDIH